MAEHDTSSSKLYGETTTQFIDHVPTETMTSIRSILSLPTLNQFGRVSHDLRDIKNRDLSGSPLVQWIG